MLWKYKKCYSETNEDIVNPVNCYKLVSGLYTDLDLAAVSSIEVSWFSCNEDNITSDLLENNNEKTINECIKFTPNFGLELFSEITETEVQNSITNNTFVTKEITINNVVVGSIKLKYGVCTEIIN